MALTPLNSFTTKAANFADRPNSSMSAAEVKAQFDAAPEELRVFVNSLITQLNADFALKSEIASALLGQILDGSLTDIKLSNTAGQAKDRLSKVITDLANFIATKGVANGVATLDGSALVSASQLSLKTITGTYTGDGSATSRLINIGFTPIFVLLCGQRNGTGNAIYHLFPSASWVDNISNIMTVVEVVISTNGFTVNATNDAANKFMNTSGMTYSYLALKG